MSYLIFVYRWTSRDLRKIITAILKSWYVKDLKRVNYVQDYCLNDNKIEKNEEKILLLQADNQYKLVDFLSKNFSNKIEKITLK